MCFGIVTPLSGSQSMLAVEMCSAKVRRLRRVGALDERWRVGGCWVGYEDV